MGHALMENRTGLVVDVEVAHATDTAEREAAKTMIGRTVTKPAATVGADKAYDVPEFVAALRKQRVTPHVAQKEKGSAIDGRTTRHPGYRTSLKVRKRVETSSAGRRPLTSYARPDFGVWRRWRRRPHLRRLQSDPAGRPVRLAVSTA